MAKAINLIAIAHLQDIRAAQKRAELVPECPRPVGYHEACVAWFAGYSVGSLAVRQFDTGGTAPRSIALL